MVALTCDEDIKCMVEEYDKLSGKITRVRLFHDCVENVKNIDEVVVRGKININDLGLNSVCYDNLVSDDCKKLVSAVDGAKNGDESLWKVATKQPLIANQTTIVNGCYGVLRVGGDLGPEEKFTTSINDTFVANTLDYRLGHAQLVASDDNNGSLPQFVGPRDLPLNSTYGNIPRLEKNGSMHCLTGLRGEVLCNGAGIGSENVGHSINLNGEIVTPSGDACGLVITPLALAHSGKPRDGYNFGMNDNRDQQRLTSLVSPINHKLTFSGFEKDKLSIEPVNVNGSGISSDTVCCNETVLGSNTELLNKAADKKPATNSKNDTKLVKEERLHQEEIQQDPPSGLQLDEKADIEESRDVKITGGIMSGLSAVCACLPTRELQTIKSWDLEYLKEIGSGTYGTVFHGKWKGSDVAIKKLKTSCFSESSKEKDRLVADFWKEAHMLGQLHHPNIVALYGVVRDGPVTNLATVTEYLVSGSLKQVLRRKDRTIDRRKRIILAMDAAFGMEYLHEKNIVHFDLKSHNFLVNMKDPRRPICKICDFGVSKIKQGTHVSAGVQGTIPWMAPELLVCKSMVTEKVDVYSFGIVMWELLTGEEPYEDMRSAESIAGIIKGTLRPEIPMWCDPAWRSLMERCWSSDPESRPSFSEIAKELCIM